MSGFHFSGKIAAVTSGSSALGQAVILDLISKGAQVYTQVAFPLTLPCKQYLTQDSFISKLSALSKIDILVLILPSSTKNDFSSSDYSDFEPHLQFLYKTIKSVWKTMRKHKYGRILAILPSESFYSYQNSVVESILSLANQGVINALKREGAKFGIKANTLIYSLTSSTDFNESQIAPVATFMLHHTFKETGSIIEAAGGSISKLRLQRSTGLQFPLSLTAESLATSFPSITAPGPHPDYPVAFSESLLKVFFMNILNKPRL